MFDEIVEFLNFSKSEDRRWIRASDLKNVFLSILPGFVSAIFLLTISVKCSRPVPPGVPSSIEYLFFAYIFA